MLCPFCRRGQLVTSAESHRGRPYWVHQCPRCLNSLCGAEPEITDAVYLAILAVDWVLRSQEIACKAEN